MAFRVLVYAIIVVHFLAIGYLIAGGFLALKWPKTIITHIAMCVWGVLIITVPTIVCPLTWSENWARRHAGMSVYADGFIDRYIENVLYPGRLTPYVRSAMALTVLISWIVLYRRWRRRAVAVRSEAPARSHVGSRAEAG